MKIQLFAERPQQDAGHRCSGNKSPLRCKRSVASPAVQVRDE
jgi:hypothetical protein